MAKHLTDKEKKKIIADYVECCNYSEVARKYNISKQTVKRICTNDTEIAQKVTQKKEENTKDVIEYMESKKQSAFEFIDLALQGMCDKEKINRTPINQLASSIGIIVDKYLLVNKLEDTETEEDGFIDALNESAVKDWDDEE